MIPAQIRQIPIIGASSRDLTAFHIRQRPRYRDLTHRFVGSPYRFIATKDTSIPSQVFFSPNSLHRASDHRNCAIPAPAGVLVLDHLTGRPSFQCGWIRDIEFSTLLIECAPPLSSISGCFKRRTSRTSAPGIPAARRSPQGFPPWPERYTGALCVRAWRR